jgi:hypothetical protein
LSWSKSRSRSRSEEAEGEAPPEGEVDGIAVEGSDTASRNHRERFGEDEEGDGYAVDREDSVDMEEYLTWAERRERKMRRREWEGGV